MKEIVILFFVLIQTTVFSQKKQYKVVSIDSTETKYVIKVQKLNTKKTTIFSSYKEGSIKLGSKIKLGEIYSFTFINKYRIGSPELRYDEKGKEKFVTGKSRFKKDNKDSSYSVIELDGLYYKLN